MWVLRNASRVCETTFAVEKQYVLHILSVCVCVCVCVCGLSYLACKGQVRVTLFSVVCLAPP
jgi:hypothetical protein